MVLSKRLTDGKGKYGKQKRNKRPVKHHYLSRATRHWNFLPRGMVDAPTQAVF